MTSPTSRKNRANALRRYPAIGYLAGAVALALLLPSGLTLPNSGPTTLAEYAPVPGQGEGTGDVSELGQASSSGGIGFGSGSGGGAPTTVAGAAGGEAGRLRRKAGNKNCVGVPPRQTEDPLSPPCVAFFEGDNGGATGKGVTGDEVNIVVEFERTESDTEKEKVADCAQAPTSEDNYRELLCKAYMSYFNDRYQTYDRRVHLWSAHYISPRLSEIDDRIQPFAYVQQGVDSRYTKLKSLSVGFNSNSERLFRENAPYLVAFRHETEKQAAITASFVCNKLKGGVARYAGDVAMRTEPRVFGLWSQSASYRADQIKTQLQQQCGIEVKVYNRSYQETGGAAKMASEGVTSVIVVDFLEVSLATVTNAATQANWFPEWIVDGTANQRGADTNFYGRFANQAQWANAIGLTFEYRRDEPGAQAWMRAYREGCPDCPPLTGTQAYPAAQGYDMLTMLFYGIQAAGPRLTVANWDKGMHAIPPNGSPNPYKPAAYFAPGNYTFVKDAAAIWWDPAGSAPGANQPGCYRLVEQGARYRAGEWPSGDANFKGPAPCQGDISTG